MKTLIVCVYMPYRGYSTSTDDFCGIVDELFEIASKYRNSHYILIGGDLNIVQAFDRKRSYLNNFIDEFELEFSCVGSIFFHPSGESESEIDYFLTTKSDSFLYKKKEIFPVVSNVSDLVLILATIKLELTDKLSNDTKSTKTSTVANVKWENLDKQAYAELVASKLDKEVTDKTMSIEKASTEICNIMRDVAIEVQYKEVKLQLLEQY
ncbi:hypothetical protein DPMN_150351 [Dreissena polymorpha]|uniref:Endonuclease/exonuclease/phosphatase domain-containing protein n=1 Tax=Dreissena polymorpha TaxID=45954 RepID=A0A9D4FDL7_DREPO|nr:hypothetical protein DPMN_150351 [Dreissena polymorpha]